MRQDKIKNTAQSHRIAETILQLIQETGLIKYEEDLHAHAWGVSKDLLSGFAASFAEQAGILERLIAASPDEDHEAEMALQTARNYLDVWG